MTQVLGTVLVSALGLPKPVFAEPPPSPDDNRYENPNYFYSVRIPKGLHCRTDPAPHPNHGCSINLSQHYRSHVWVDGSYNTLARETAADALFYALDSELRSGCTLEISRREPALLGSLQAERISFHHTCGKEWLAHEYVVALRSIPNCCELIYTVAFVSTLETEATHRALLEEIVASWTNLTPEEAPKRAPVSD
ncbi:MAG: hypothetical protein HY791_26810 [Deltaproteobacteria bacterium]|nr:hypothetical protein [Deltaproteobacteria bacterium]